MSWRFKLPGWSVPGWFTSILNPCTTANHQMVAAATVGSTFEVKSWPNYWGVSTGCITDACWIVYQAFQLSAITPWENPWRFLRTLLKKRVDMCWPNSCRPWTPNKISMWSRASWVQGWAQLSSLGIGYIMFPSGFSNIYQQVTELDMESERIHLSSSHQKINGKPW